MQRRQRWQMMTLILLAPFVWFCGWLSSVVESADETRRQSPAKVGAVSQSPGVTPMFSEKEAAYIKSQRLARIATVSKKQQPDVAPVVFEFDGEYFYIGGRNNPATMKYRNVARGNTRVAIVFDDWESLTPWKPRSLKIRTLPVSLVDFLVVLHCPHVC